MRPSFRVNDLCKYYALRQTAKNVVVEGPTDLARFRALIRSEGDLDVAVYHAGAYDFAGTAFHGNALKGSRAQATSLAHHLDQCAHDLTHNVVVVIDSDFDAVRGSEDNRRYLLRTDAADLLTYGFEASALDEILSVGLHGVMPADDFVATFFPILNFAFRARLVNDSQAYGLPFDKIEISRFLTYRKGQPLEFRSDAFLLALATGAGYGKSAQHEILGNIVTTSADEKIPRSAQINGHDFAEVVAYCSRAMTSKVRISKEAAEGLILVCARDVIARSPMFTEVRRRLSF